MAKRTSKYWQERFKQVEEAQHNIGTECYADIEKQYRQAQRQIEGQIAYWYQRLADNNDMSIEKAMKLLNADELKEFKWEVEDYIKYGKENAINQKWMTELENASAKYHIKRLDALKLQTQQSIEALYAQQDKSVNKTMRTAYKEGYYRTAYEIQKGVEIGSTFARLDENKVSKVINKPWAADGRNFSDRIWTNKEKLINELNTTLTQNIMLGQDPQKAIDAIAKKMKVSKTTAGRLVMTEQAFFSSAAQKDCFKELDVEEFEIVATLDDRTSEICQNMDGRHFPMSEYEIGVTAPPFHVNCRSCTCPYFNDEFSQGGQRAARDEETGKTYYVPENMTYKEWKQAFVDGNTSGLQEAETGDTITLWDAISEQDTKIEKLKEQFSDETDGYSYDDWFKEFSSIEDGFGGVTAENKSDIAKLKEIDEKIKAAQQEKRSLLLQKEKRGQIDTGYSGKIPDEKLDEYNAKAFEQIKLDTGYSDEEATKLHTALQEYFGGDYDKILSGETETAKTISKGLDRMPVYNGSVYRGLSFSETADGNIAQFTNLKPGDKVPARGVLSSWSSNERAAESFGCLSTKCADSDSVILECVDNKTGVGVQHISKFGDREAEVLSNANYEVVEVITESKYDYASRRKDLLYFSDDLTERESELKRHKVCIIKVKEV